jgi:hypothetical protein
VIWRKTIAAQGKNKGREKACRAVMEQTRDGIKRGTAPSESLLLLPFLLQVLEAPGFSIYIFPLLELIQSLVLSTIFMMKLHLH